MSWIAALLAHVDEHGIDEVEPTAEAERSWVEHVCQRADQTLYPAVTSYYNGDEVPGKPRVFMPYVGGVRAYRRILERVVAEGYDGWAMYRLARAAA